MKTKNQYAFFTFLMVLITMLIAAFLGSITSCAPRVIRNKKCDNGQIQVTTIQLIKIATFTTDFKQGFLTKNKLR